MNKHKYIIADKYETAWEDSFKTWLSIYPDSDHPLDEEHYK